MTQEDKKLLLKDLAARLPYKVNVCLYEKETCILMGIDRYEVYLDVDSDSFRIESIKPYLRPMPSMTEEEKDEYSSFVLREYDGYLNDDMPDYTGKHYVYTDNVNIFTDWLNAHHFDHRHLIEKGLALEAPEGMYNI